MLGRRRSMSPVFMLLFSYYISSFNFIEHHGVESFSSVATRASIPKSLPKSPRFTLQAKTDRVNKVAENERYQSFPNVVSQSQSSGCRSHREAKGLVLATLLSILSLSPTLGNVVPPANAFPNPASTAITIMPIGQAVIASSISASTSFVVTTPDPTTTTTTTTTNTQIAVPSIAKKGMPRVASIMDLAGVLDPDRDVPNIIQAMNEAQQKTQSEIQILIVNKVEKGYTPKKMATTLFNQWKLGSSQKNNGVLLLVVLDERRTELEVGQALDAAFSKEWCQTTLQETASPAFRQEQYGKGLLATVQRVSQRLDEVDRGGELLLLSNRKNWFGNMSGGARMSLFAYGLTFSLFFFFANEARYPIKVNCPSCNANRDTWETDYKVTLEATDEQEGEEELIGTCANCGHVYTQTRPIRKYDGSTVDGDGNTSYYYNDSSSSSDSGGSSDGGGGGDSW
ncbi:unnamed protein product [Cylindrotheca closterium]|uniref:TPM domain-containing protein n=1 Tax=Cylindrotheca closterium TaxID=2856 RepID=A0AAD2JI93_9STRA|nr:unnamed protein product [Cylindrotheca closterium]